MDSLQSYQNKIFNDYIQSTFSISNNFDKKEYESNFLNYQMNYGNYLPESKNSKILDVGCGSGHFLYFLKKKGYKNILGIDVSPQQITFCRNHITNDVLNTDIFDYLLNNKQQFDTIIANDFIEHLNKEKILPFLKKVKNSLNGSGLFIVKTPNMENPFSLYSRYCDFTHEVGFTAKSLNQILLVCGFKDIKIFPAKNYIQNKFKKKIEDKAKKIIYAIFKKAMQIQGFINPRISSLNLVAISKKGQ